VVVAGCNAVHCAIPINVLVGVHAVMRAQRDGGPRASGWDEREKV
jgi:hypothetical protein